MLLSTFHNTVQQTGSIVTASHQGLWSFVPKEGPLEQPQLRGGGAQEPTGESMTWLWGRSL